MEKLMFDLVTLREYLQSGAICLMQINEEEGLTKYAQGRLACMNAIIEKIKDIEEANKE